MLMANETIAEDYFWQDIRLYTVPTITRTRRR